MTRLAMATLLLCGCTDFLDETFSEPRGDCQAVLASGIAFSEIMVGDGPGPGGDYLEVFNPSPYDLDLTGVEVSVEGAGETRSAVIAFEDDEIEVAAGHYWVLAGADHELRPAFAGFGYGSALGQLPAEGTAVLQCDGQELDRVSWSSPRAGRSLQLSADVFPTPASNDAMESFCASPRQYVTGRYGSPGQLNTVCFAADRLCQDDVGDFRPKIRPEVGDLVITEVMANPSAVFDAAGEWFEIYARHSFDLNDVLVTSNETKGLPLGGQSCLRLSEGARAVFSRSEAPQARLPHVDHLFATALVNTGDRLSLELAGIELDSVEWSSTADGASLVLDPDHRSATANDLPENWCLERTLAPNGDRASPGVQNSDC